MKVFSSVFTLLFLIILCGSCEQKECCDLPLEEVTIQWTGDYATDGCGYIFNFVGAGKERKATNEEIIPDRFKTGVPIQVAIEMDSLNEMASRLCFSLQEFETFKLVSIE